MGAADPDQPEEPYDWDDEWQPRRGLRYYASEILLMLLGLVLYAIYYPAVLLINIPRYLIHLIRRARIEILGRMVGTATEQRRLEGKIIAAKQDVLRKYLALIELDRDQPELRWKDIEDLKKQIGYEDASSGIRFSIYYPRWPFEEDWEAEPDHSTDAYGSPVNQSLSYYQEPEGHYEDTGLDESVLYEVEEPESEYHEYARQSLFQYGPRVPQRHYYPEADRPIPEDSLWAVTAMDLLNRAQRDLTRNTKTAYRAYLQAKRIIVNGEYLLYKRMAATPGSDGDLTDPIRTRANLVLDEAEAYDDALSVVRDLLCDSRESARILLSEIIEREDESVAVEGDVVRSPTEADRVYELKEDISPALLEKAMEVLHEREINEYLQVESLRVTILGFVGLPVLLVVGLLLFSPAFMRDSLDPVTATMAVEPVTIPWVGWSGSLQPEQLFFGLVLLFGAIGAAISGMRTIELDTGSLQSLGEILGYWLALVRIVIGAISAFIVSIFLFSGAIDQGVLSLPLVLGISLAAGFSERLAIRAIASFEQRALPETGAHPKGSRSESD